MGLVCCSALCGLGRLSSMGFARLVQLAMSWRMLAYSLCVNIITAGLLSNREGNFCFGGVLSYAT